MAARQRGRPRSFDRDAALDQALTAFWRHGYEPTSIADLTAAMGIGAPSLYAAFGDKRALFMEVVDRYVGQYGGFVQRALDEEPTARQAVNRLLREAALEYTRPGRPPGCLVVNAAVNCTEAAGEVVERLRALREGNVALLRRRIAAGAAAGELSGEADPEALARLVAAVMQGMSQQARDGVSRAELMAVAEAATAGWPGPAEPAYPAER